jgi:hypothetical protein
MPLSPTFAQSLIGIVLTISLQSGWKWQRRSESGEWYSFEAPQAQLTVKDIALVQPTLPVLGFTGVVESARPEFSGLSLMALAHTTETVGNDDVVPLALALSPQMPTLAPDASKPSGHTAIPQGNPAYLGFGILVPTDLADDAA